MKISHALGGAAAEKRIADYGSQELSFFLSSGNGGFAHFAASSLPTSKYQGFFTKTALGLVKSIESIHPVSGEKVAAVKNSEGSAAFQRGSFSESFFVPQNRNCLVYQLSRELPVEVFLDARLANDFRQWGRHYGVSEEKGCVVARFAKKTDSREDSTTNKEEFAVAVAIKHDGNLDRVCGEWVRRNYSLDAKRNSASERYVYKAAAISAKTLVISAAASAADAIKEACSVSKSLAKLKKESAAHYDSLCKGGSGSETALASDSARVALEKLKTPSGLYAGLPWFFQEWSRDELVSCIAFPTEARKNAVLKCVEAVLEDGRLPNILDGGYGGSPRGSADGIGWLFKRASELAEENALAATEAKKIKTALKKSIDHLLKSHCRNGFMLNEKNETWMDTDFKDDGRKGACIEIQAMQLNMYRLMHRLSHEKTYGLLENSLRQNVRKFFWNGSILADRLNDFTARPNLFVAAYVYPGLLSKKEWETCITTALPKLWLDWGGLATIDKAHKNFRSSYTGETNASYHRGDSWYWINNIAAMVMHNVNRKRFGAYIGKIAAASADDILWKGAVGCASELSSAAEQKPEGCLNQAWSNATFVELASRLKRGKIKL